MIKHPPGKGYGFNNGNANPNGNAYGAIEMSIDNDVLTLVFILIGIMLGCFFIMRLIALKIDNDDTNSTDNKNA